MFFLSDEEVLALAGRHGTPFFAYSEEVVERNARVLLGFPDYAGKGLRYAVKANPNQNIVRLLQRQGFAFEVGSSYEALRLLELGIAAEEILLTSQEVSETSLDLVEEGVLFNATSLYQLDRFGKRFPGRSLMVRFNPGLGSGGFPSVNVGGRQSSFGVWFEHRAKVSQLLDEHRLVLVGLHTHIGSGADPKVWKAAANATLGLAASFSSVRTINLGGGFPIPRSPEDKPIDLEEVGLAVREVFAAFDRKHARRLRLELEPGTFLVGNAGELIAQVQDKVDTGKDGFQFLKLDTGMDSLLRPALYGAGHAFRGIRKSKDEAPSNPSDLPVVVVGHCCEATDTLGEASQTLAQLNIGDYLSIANAGAYCSAMAAKHYNSFPEPPEILKRNTGEFVVVRERQPLSQLSQNEVQAI